MEVKVLGTGCAKCERLYQEAQRALESAGVEATLTKVEKLDEIIAYGVMMTPALVVDGEVKSSGRLVRAEEIAGWLAEAGRRG